MPKPTAEDLRQVREFQEALLLPSAQQRRLAEIKAMPSSTDQDDCICAALKLCAKTDNPCPYCRASDSYAGCPQLGFGCGLLDDECDCCTPEQKSAAARGRA